MARGRKPTPPALKELTGNPGKRPINTSAPKIDEVDTTCPDGLDEIATAEWNRIAPTLAAMGIFSVADRAALEAYCTAYSIMRQVRAQLGNNYATMTERGLKRNPLVEILNKQMEIIRSFASEFGLTPSSRGRMQLLGAKDDEDDGMEELVD